MKAVFETDLIKNDLYQLEIETLKDKTFSVISFKGNEQLCQNWQIDLFVAGPTLFEDLTDISTDDIIDSKALFKIKAIPTDDILYYSGIIRHFEMQSQLDSGIFLYQLTLESPLSAMTNNKKEKLFMAITPDEILKYMNKAYPGITLDITLSKTDYPVKPFIPQSDESDLDFMHRVMEHWGIYYYFEHDDKDTHKIVVRDSNPSTDSVSVSFGKYGDLLFDHSILYRMSHQLKKVPATVVVKDYNYKKAKVEINETATVLENGIGTTVYHNQNTSTSEEAKFIAGIRAEQLKCSRETFKGRVSTPSVYPGIHLKPENHPIYTDTYLVYQTQFSGNCTSMLKEKYKKYIPVKDTDPVFSNHFNAIVKDTLFRPGISTPIPDQQSIVNATIANKKNLSGEESDDDFITENGEFLWKDPKKDYHLKEDIEEHSTVRNATPDIGSKHETSFPLKHDDEVAVSFERGNLSRPVILNALFNSENESPVTSKNDKSSIMELPGDNKITMKDADGTDEGILIKADQHDSYIAMGNIKETRDERGTEKSWFDFITDPIDYGIVLKTDEHLVQKTKKEEEEFWEQSIQYTTGTTLDVILGYHGIAVIGLNTAVALGLGTKFNLADATKVNEKIEEFFEHKTEEILAEEGLGEEEATAETIRTDLGIDRNRVIANAVAAKMTEARAYVDSMREYVENIRVQKESMEADALRSRQIAENLQVHENEVKSAIVEKKETVVMQASGVDRQVMAPLMDEVREVGQTIEAIADDCRFFGIIGE